MQGWRWSHIRGPCLSVLLGLRFNRTCMNFALPDETFLQFTTINYEKQTPNTSRTNVNLCKTHMTAWISLRLVCMEGVLACVGRSKALEQWSFYCATWIRPFSFFPIAYGHAAWVADVIGTLHTLTRIQSIWRISDFLFESACYWNQFKLVFFFFLALEHLQGKDQGDVSESRWVQLMLSG